jgi:hypothetical protein
MTSIFISYSSKDVKIAENIQEYLEDNDFDVWRDKSDSIFRPKENIDNIIHDICYLDIQYIVSVVSQMEHLQYFL